MGAYPDLSARRPFQVNPEPERSRLMSTVTVEGEKAFEVEEGKKLVLAIEDAGIDILHRCGGNARCTTCRVVVLAGEAPPMGNAEQERLARVRSRPEYAAFLPDPR